jgi:hypothetical protein
MDGLFDFAGELRGGGIFVTLQDACYEQNNFFLDAIVIFGSWVS